MHPDQLYTLAQQHAERLRREANHFRLTREARHSPVANHFHRSSQDESRHWPTKVARYLAVRGGAR